MLRHLVAAPDKFRGTATAADVAAAAGRAARAHGWTVDEIPLADGGEGTLEVVGGTPRHTVVTGPLGDPVVAQWRILRDPGPGSVTALLPTQGGPTAVVEAARAAGRALLPSPSGDDPVRATTTGVGELVLAAVDAGAGRVVVAAGGSATTDGGWGAVQAIGSRDRLRGAEVVVAYDVRTPFRAAAAVFGPQKGATPAQVAVERHRLDELAERYRRDFGVDVDDLEGAGAAGGLAGGLAALGAALVPGWDVVSSLVELPRRVAGATLVMTGEGRLDPTSFQGKVVGGVIATVAGRVPVLCVAGSVDPRMSVPVPAGPSLTVVSLVETVGRERAWHDTTQAVEEVVGGELCRAACAR